MQQRAESNNSNDIFSECQESARTVLSSAVFTRFIVITSIGKGKAKYMYMYPFLSFMQAICNCKL